MTEPASLQDHTRVYLRRGHPARRSHLLHVNASPNRSYPPSLCGIELEWLEVWYGTGSQAEWDHARALPLCKKCLGWVLLIEAAKSRAKECREANRAHQREIRERYERKKRERGG